MESVLEIDESIDYDATLGSLSYAILQMNLRQELKFDWNEVLKLSNFDNF